MEHVNKWCSLGEKIYRTCKHIDGRLVPPSMADLLVTAHDLVGHDVWEVHDLGKNARLAWCAKYNEPLQRQYKITGVAGIDLSEARWYVSQHDAWHCPLITFFAESVFVDAESKQPKICTGLHISSDNIFLSEADVRRHFKKMYRYTEDMFNREFCSVKHYIGEARSSFYSFFSWFRNNGELLGIDRKDMDRAFAQLIQEAQDRVDEVKKCYKENT